jgi:hypothetical protein
VPAPDGAIKHQTKKRRRVMKHFYAAINTYGSETGIGLSNTWGVMSFPSKKERDKFVSELKDTNISVRPILSSDVKTYNCIGVREYMEKYYPEYSKFAMRG